MPSPLRTYLERLVSHGQPTHPMPCLHLGLKRCVRLPSGCGLLHVIRRRVYVVLGLDHVRAQLLDTSVWISSIHCNKAVLAQTYIVCCRIQSVMAAGAWAFWKSWLCLAPLDLPAPGPPGRVSLFPCLKAPQTQHCFLFLFVWLFFSVYPCSAVGSLLASFISWPGLTWAALQRLERWQCAHTFQST